MVAFSLIAAISAVQSVADPLQLPIGTRGQIEVASGELASTKTGKPATIDEIVQEAKGKAFVYIGESHTNPEHHKFQAAVIDALAASGRRVAVGFEMFTRPAQEDLDPWTLGWWSEDQFIQESDWKHQWGYDFALYRPIFDTIKKDRIPMVALNIPRPWVHTVATGGYGALSSDERSQLPSDLGYLNKEHQKVFDAMIGGHPAGADVGHMYDAQVLWDQAMADTAIKYLKVNPQPSNAVFVVIAGSGHLMYKQGINWRIEHRTGKPGVTIIMIDDDSPKSVSRGLGDFVYKKGSEAQNGSG